MCGAEALDLGADIRFGVKPGSGDRRRLSDRFEGDGSALGVEFAKGLDRFGSGQLVALLGGGDDVAGVVSTHRRPRFRRCRLPAR